MGAFMVGLVLIVGMLCVADVAKKIIDKNGSDISWKHYNLLVKKLDEIQKEMRDK